MRKSPGKHLVTRKGKTFVRGKGSLAKRISESEHGEQYRRLMDHKRRLAGHHPQDDSPFSEYDGYTVSDARKQISDKLAKIKEKYITPEEKEAKESSMVKSEKKKKITDKQKYAARDEAIKKDKALLKSDPKYAAASKIRFEASYRVGIPKKYRGDNSDITQKALKAGFKSIADALKYYDSVAVKIPTKKSIDWDTQIAKIKSKNK